MLRFRGHAVRALGNTYVCSSCLLSFSNRSARLRPTIADLARSPRPRSCRFYVSNQQNHCPETIPNPVSLETEAREHGKDSNDSASSADAGELGTEVLDNATGETQPSSGTILEQVQHAASESQALPTTVEESPHPAEGDGSAAADATKKGGRSKTKKPRRLIRFIFAKESTEEKKKTVEKKAPKVQAQPSKKARPGKEIQIQEINSKNLGLTAIEHAQPPVPRLSYGLDRVLFNPGVYNLQDPRSKVFNFDPYLAEIMPIQEFDFNALKQYITSSKDNALISIAAQHSKKYAGSTSSMTSMLAHFHFLLSAWRPIGTSSMSRGFTVDSTNFTGINRSPAAVFLHYKDGTYAIDADKEFDTANILSMLGKSMEKLLTLPKEEYEKYRRGNSDQITDEQRNEPESYHYTTMGDFMMRSQLDAYDPRIRGTGMFDLKTRAVVSIRMDAKDFHKGLGYEIRHRMGQWESYEREYYDMIRSAFLKYSLQVRMGRMDGIFVAFHNTQRIFGFQYISLGEMDRALHGGDNGVGDHEFKLSLRLLNEVLDKATQRFPKQSLRLHFETRPSDTPFMYVFAKPVTPEDIEEVQGASRVAIEEFERSILGLGTESAETGNEESKSVQSENTEGVEVPGNEEAALEKSEESTQEGGEEAALDGGEEEERESSDQATYTAWEHMLDKVEETLQDDEQGIGSVREAIGDALQQIGLLRAHSSEETRVYLDNMLETITGRTVFSEEQAPSSEETESSSTEVEADHEMEELLTNSMESSGEAIEADDASAQETEGHEQEALAAASSAPADSPSLKDLILKLAQSSNATAEYHARQSQDQDAALGHTKLRKFGEILSELRSKSQEQIEALTEGHAAEAKANAEAAASPDTSAPPPTLDSDESSPEVLGMVLTIKNKVNGHYVTRPESFRATDKWSVEYSIEEMPPARVARHYDMMRARRKKLLVKVEGDETSRWYQMFRGDLQRYSERGRDYRARQNTLGPHFPVYVYGLDKPLKWRDVFKRSKVQAKKATAGDKTKAKGQNVEKERKVNGTTTKGQVTKKGVDETSAKEQDAEKEADETTVEGQDAEKGGKIIEKE